MKSTKPLIRNLKSQTTVLLGTLVTTVSIFTLVCYVLIGTQHNRGVKSFTPGEEAQEIAEAVLDAETKLGELTSKMEKAANQYASNSGVTTKKKKLEQIGLSKMDASRYETLANHPEQVEKAKAVLIPP